MHTGKRDEQSGAGIGREAVSEGRELCLSIGSEMIVRSIANSMHKTKSRIIGAVHGKFILIEEPVVVVNERMSIPIEGGVLCSYFESGDLYTFRSRVLKNLDEDMVSIQYPGEVEIRQIRRHKRIRVNIETEVTIPGLVSMIGDMGDISIGGCCVTLNSIAPLVRGKSLTLTFCLPNDQTVNGLKCSVASVKHIRSEQKTIIGLSFTSPAREIAKVTSFCEFCMFFELE